MQDVDQLEQQVGVAVAVREVADFVDDQGVWGGVVAESASEGGVAVQLGQLAEQLPGAGEQTGGTLEHGLVGQVLRLRLLQARTHRIDVISDLGQNTVRYQDSALPPELANTPIAILRLDRKQVRRGKPNPVVLDYLKSAEAQVTLESRLK